MLYEWTCIDIGDVGGSFDFKVLAPQMMGESAFRVSTSRLDSA